MISRFIFVFFHCVPVFVFGQSQAVNPDSALQRILGEFKGAPLTLEAAKKAARKNSPSVRRAEAFYLAASGAVRREKGAFDPELFSTFNYQYGEEATASFFSGAPVLLTRQNTSTSGLRMALPTGTELEASLNIMRLRANSAFSSLNPQYTAFGNLTMRQPLLGGFRATAREALTRSERELEAAEARYNQEILGINAEVERAYWDLYAAERNYAVRKLLQQQGEAFLRDAELRAQAGLIGPSQVASAETFLAEQNLLLISEEEALDRLSDALFILFGEKPQNGTTRFIAIDEPPGELPVQPFEKLLNEAIQNNSNLKAAKAEIAALRISARAAGWQVLPQVDVVGSIGGTGLAGTGQQVTFGGTVVPAPPSSSLGDAISDIGKREFKTWAIGVEFNIPIGFRSGLGEKERLKSQVIIAEQNYIEQLRNLEAQVRSSHRELVNSSRRIEAALNGVAAAQKQVQIGQVEFRNGRSTAFELVRLSADFALAHQRYSEALVKTAKAAVTLDELTAGKYLVK